MMYDAAENNFAESGVCCLEDAIIRTLLVCWHESIIRSPLVASSLLSGVCWHESSESVSFRTSQGLKIPRVGIFPNVQVSSSLSTSLDAVCTESSLPEPVRPLETNPILQAQLDQPGHPVGSFLTLDYEKKVPGVCVYGCGVSSRQRLGLRERWGCFLSATTNAQTNDIDKTVVPVCVVATK
jgi:hypothetical protein